jgi:hypothetical protein
MPMEESPQFGELQTDPTLREQTRKSYLILCGFVLLIGAGYILYSQTWAFAWDEGFHMLTAQLIKDGRLPYIDFFFPQTPLNAFWNAGWMRVFGDSWRMVHALAAIQATGAIFLTADFVYRHLPVPRWRLSASLLTAVLVGANIQVFQFAPVGQGYALALFLSVAAFRLTVWAVGARSPLAAGTAGLVASAAAGATLLSAPYAPVLLLWLSIYNRVGRRWTKFVAFLVGAVVAWLPMIWLFVRSPRVVRFNIFDYHMRYREVDWSDAIPHDIDVLTSWLESSQALVLGLLAIAGLAYALSVARRGARAYSTSVGSTSDECDGYLPDVAWDRGRAELYLCAWLTLAEAIHISRAHPTFARYFLLVVAPMSILATTGLYVVGSRLGRPDRPWWAVAPTMLFLLLGIARATYDERGEMHWSDLLKIANKVKEVTPPGATLLADEQIYFLTNRIPPEGLEHRDAHKLKLDATLSKMLHVISKADLKKKVANGAFTSAESCDDDEMDDLGLADLYEHNAEFDDCKVFWGPKGKATKVPSK